MSLESELARQLMRAHPERAAVVLDRLGTEDVVVILASAGAAEAATLLQHLSPHVAVKALEAVGPEHAAEVVAVLELDVAARLVRRLGDVRRDEALERLDAGTARALRTLLRFPENTAGALMDPHVLALPEDLTAQEALGQAREAPEWTRYNVYVLDRDQVLVGVLNLRELLLASPKARLTEVMTRHPSRLDAHADRSTVVSHPGWKEVHAIPVVDENGCYLGAVRYRTLRQLEGELLGNGLGDGNASEALGELFAAGAIGLLDALTASRGTRR